MSMRGRDPGMLGPTGSFGLPFLEVNLGGFGAGNGIVYNGPVSI